MVGQWIFSTKQLEIDQFCVGELLGWDLEFEVEEIARIMKEYVQHGGPLYPEPIWVPLYHFEDDRANDSAIVTSRGENVKAKSYLDLESWTRFPVSNELERTG